MKSVFEIIMNLFMVASKSMLPKIGPLYICYLDEVDTKELGYICTINQTI